jgi:hypothetical protein
MPETERARWYPEMLPALEGESADAYTDRLTGADKTNRVPYDHKRNRQCSIGYHAECSDPAGLSCMCPCHREPPPVVKRMTVGPLRELLKTLPEDMPIVLEIARENEVDDGNDLVQAFLTVGAVEERCDEIQTLYLWGDEDQVFE